MYQDLDKKTQEKIKILLRRNDFVKAKKIYSEAVKKLTSRQLKVES